MRTSFLAWPIAALATVIFVGCGLEQLSQGGGSGSSAATKGDAGSDADAGIQGAGCGIESGSGQQLCIATSICPTVIVDTSSLPHCGFRIKGSTSELVCACGDLICSMGAFTTCSQAASLLSSQTEGAVCAQVPDGRCFGAAPTSSGSTSSSGSRPTCDRKCMQECGGGAACASICGC